MPDQEHQEFDFIKEKIIDKKKNRRNDFLYSIVKTVICSVLFGFLSAGIFVVFEPQIAKLFGKETVEVKEEINLITNLPEIEPIITPERVSTGVSEDMTPIIDTDNQFLEPDAVIVEKSIEASLEDYISIRNEIRKIAVEANQAMVSVVSTKSSTDWFQNPIVKTTSTTGLVLGNNGVELTVLVSYDRVKGASKTLIYFSNQYEVEAKLLDYEEELNLAVITAKLQEIPNTVLENIKTAKFGESYTLSVGTPIIAVGNPNGYANSIEDGIITSKGSYVYVTDNRIDLFNTSISNNDNADGVILNLQGEIIGMITRTLKEDKNQGLNTAISISKLVPIIERLANAKPRIYFGIKAEDMTETALRQNGLDVAGGIYLNEVIQNSPAFDAGLKGGDILISVNDVLMKSTSLFYNKISEFNAGEEIEIKYISTTQTSRDIQKIKVTLGEKKEEK